MRQLSSAVCCQMKTVGKDRHIFLEYAAQPRPRAQTRAHTLKSQVSWVLVQRIFGEIRHHNIPSRRCTIQKQRRFPESNTCTQALAPQNQGLRSEVWQNAVLRGPNRSSSKRTEHRTGQAMCRGIMPPSCRRPRQEPQPQQFSSLSVSHTGRPVRVSHRSVSHTGFVEEPSSEKHKP